MKKRWSVAAIAVAACVAALLSAPAATATALGSSDFLKANGAVLKNNSGTGSTVNLRGTNLGGWLTQEDWMSPLGEFAVDRTGWSASASSGASTADAIDGSDSTRWTTGAAQAGTEWLQVDLGAPTLFNRLSVNNTNFAGDYPRQYEVSVSTNGTSWVSVAKAAGTDVLMARFPAQVDRYVRIAQLGSAANWWSVGEFNLYNDPVLYNGTSSASASSTGSGTTAG
ncbi:MAG TPA: discoidin domain-containing protein, partial [Steroidobacteraceae bacterium]